MNCTGLSAALSISPSPQEPYISGSVAQVAMFCIEAAESAGRLAERARRSDWLDSTGSNGTGKS